MDNTQENIEKLVEAVLSSWDAEDMARFLRERLTYEYEESPRLFEEDWNVYIG
jgi:hypothetical protein